MATSRPQERTEVPFCEQLGSRGRKTLHLVEKGQDKIMRQTDAAAKATAMQGLLRVCEGV